MIVVIVCTGFLAMFIATYLLARTGRGSRGNVIPAHQLPAELQCQELERLTFQHRVRTRTILDSALHDIQKVTGEHRDDG